MCGTPLTGDDRDAQLAAAREHLGAAHPELDLTDVQLRNFFERGEQIAEPAAPLPEIGPVQIIDLDASRIDDLLEFFDRDAFAGNAGWASCYCMAHHIDEGDRWDERTWQQNRADLADRIRAGRTTGTLAYVDGKLVGWCNASQLLEFPDYGHRASDGSTGAVACFIIAPAYRGHGLARRLLDGAVDQFRRRGAIAVEGFPNPNADNPASAYKGTVSLFESAGFKKADDGPPLRMRLDLA